MDEHMKACAGFNIIHSEALCLERSDARIIKKRIALILSPVPHETEGELLRSNDMLVVEKDSSPLTGWYKNWNTSYVATSFYQHGGD